MGILIINLIIFSGFTVMLVGVWVGVIVCVGVIVWVWVEIVK
jgi:hypothetical protein